MTEAEKEEVFFTLNCLDSDANEAQAIELINKSPFIATYFFEERVQVLPHLAMLGFERAVSRLVELGADVNYLHPDGNSSLPLAKAIRYARLQTAETLLKNGANPNRERIVLSAINCEHSDQEGRVELVKLLVRYGARLNDLYAMFGDKKNVRTALDFVSKGSSMFAFLQSIGAKSAKEVLAENPKAPISDE